MNHANIHKLRVEIKRLRARWMLRGKDKEEQELLSKIGKRFSKVRDRQAVRKLLMRYCPKYIGQVSLVEPNEKAIRESQKLVSASSRRLESKRVHSRHQVKRLRKMCMRARSSGRDWIEHQKNEEKLHRFRKSVKSLLYASEAMGRKHLGNLRKLGKLLGEDRDLHMSVESVDNEECVKVLQQARKELRKRERKLYKRAF